MKKLAIIPARGGSKRIPRKNIRDFLGRPVIAYSIEAALSSSLFDTVMVSTDDEEIAEIATRYGASVPFMRNEITSGDYATLSDVIEEVKQCYKERDERFDYICCILPTVPLIKIDNLVKGFSLLLQNDVDSVRPLVRFSYPIQRAYRMKDGKIAMFSPEYLNSRSQDLEPSYHDAGQFYWMRSGPGLRGANKMGFEIPGMDAQDIDSEEDWKMAEIKYRLIK